MFIIVKVDEVSVLASIAAESKKHVILRLTKSVFFVFFFFFHWEDYGRCFEIEAVHNTS